MGGRRSKGCGIRIDRCRRRPAQFSNRAAASCGNVRESGKTVIVPLAPRAARALDLAIGDRSQGPLFVGFDGERLDATPRHGSCDGSLAGRESTSPSGSEPCATRSSPPPSTRAYRYATRTKRPVTPIRPPRWHYDRASVSLGGTPLTSAPRPSLKSPDNHQPASSGAYMSAPERPSALSPAESGLATHAARAATVVRPW